LPISLTTFILVVGGGFFTMKHGFRNELDEIYSEYDAFAVYRIVYDEIERLNTHFYDNFFMINKDTPQKRMDRTEYDLTEPFWLRYEISLLSKKSSHMPVLVDNLPLPRALIGTNSNAPFS
jgi:hypothetical protein